MNVFICPFLPFVKFFFQAIVCGIHRKGKINFHPYDDEVLEQADKVCEQFILIIFCVANFRMVAQQS